MQLYFAQENQILSTLSVFSTFLVYECDMSWLHLFLKGGVSTIAALSVKIGHFRNTW